MDGDADLVARVRRGDRQAFDDLYDRYADDVFSMCLVVLGDPTVARAAAGTAFALVARTRMNPLSEPARLRSWLLELARGSALAWSGSPQARSAPVPHGISAEDMIDGAVVPAPASLRTGLARTFDRAASAAAHERAAQERLAARPGYTDEPSALPIRTTGAAVAMAGAAAFADTDADPDATLRGVPGPVGAAGLGAVAAAGLADAPTIAPSAAGAATVPSGAAGAGSNAAAAAASKGAADGGNLAQAADQVTRAAHATAKSAGPAQAHGGNAAQAAADHAAKAASHDPAATATAHGNAAGAHGNAAGLVKSAGGRSTATSHAATSHAATGHHAVHGTAGHGDAADAPTEVGVAQHQDALDAVTSPGHLPTVDVDPPTVDVDLGEATIVPFPDHSSPSPSAHDADRHYYADGQGAPLVPIDGVDGRRRQGPDWRTRPAIAVAASLVVAIAGITAALNWPAPAAQLAVQDVPHVAIVAPSLDVSDGPGKSSTERPVPPGPAAAPTVGATDRPESGGKPRLVSEDRPISTAPPAPAPRGGGAAEAPATAGPETTSQPANSTPAPTRTTTPTRTTPAPTRTTPAPTRTTTAPTTDAPAPTTSAPAPTTAAPTTPSAPPKTTTPAPPPTEGSGSTASSAGTVGSGTTANL